MAKKPTRLRFTEDDLADSHVKKAANRADKAADKAEKAVDKLASKKKTTKLRLEKDAAGSRKAKLRFEKADITEIECSPCRTDRRCTAKVHGLSCFRNSCSRWADSPHPWQ